jgi:molybdate transport system substrate-binding protein
MMVALAVACSAGDAPPAPAAASPRAAVLTVFAAASLRDAMLAIEGSFEALHPTVDVRCTFAGTQQLRAQLEHGASADVFAAADLAHMQALERAGIVGVSAVFATNEPVIVVAVRDGVPSATIAGVRDLGAVRRLVLGAADVPIGRYTAAILAAASHRYGPEVVAAIAARVVSRELDVRQALAKVRLGEADASIVYRSDLVGAGPDLVAVSIEPELNVVATYPIAVVERSSAPELARAFVAHARGPQGHAGLVAAGFGLPPADAPQGAGSAAAAPARPPEADGR